MDKSTQEISFRQALISYAEKYGATKAAIRYKSSRQYTDTGGSGDMTAQTTL